MCYYRFDQLAELAFKSVEPHVNSMIMCQGRWKKFLMQTERDSFVYEDEIAHRNAAISQVPDGDYFVTVDSDEIFFGAWKKTLNKLFSRKCAVGWVNCYDLTGNIVPRPRLIFKTADLHYKINHFTMVSNNKKVYLGKPRKYERIYPLNFFHLTALRDEEYIQARKEYIKVRTEPIENWNVEAI